MRLNKGLIFSVFLLVFIVGVLAFVFATDGTFISTNKPDYAPEETVLISGEGFTPLTPMTISVTRPDGTDSCSVSSCNQRFVSGLLTSDFSGSFSDYAYFLQGVEGSYSVLASDGTTSVTTIFTDCICQYTVESYSSNTYSIVKNNFLQGETVYAKGTRSSASNIKLRFRNPSDVVVYTCPSNYGSTTTCSYNLSANAPTGEWDIQIGYYHDNNWQWYTDCGGLDHFNVQSGCTPNCNGKQCGDNGCGGNCGTCSQGHICNAQQQCIPIITDQCQHDSDCVDSTVCNGAETCVSGVCTSGTALVCDDNNVCTDDVCNPTTGCVVTNNNGPCTTGLFCTVGDTCSNGQCVSGAPRDCSANNLLGINTCDNDPDNIHFTWDTRSSFTSVCNEDTDSCTTGNNEITHTCNVSQCGAQCDSQHSCSPSLVGTTCNFNGACSGSCSCSYQSSEYCPLPGTVKDETCYYGTQSCTSDGCVGILNAPMGCNSVCDPALGPIDKTGPVTSNLIATKLPGQCKINIEADETDTCSNIAAAEYFIEGSGCGLPGTGTPMNAKDENFNNPFESVIANNIGVQDGSFNIYVRGKDANGNWGTCQAIRMDADCIPPDYPTCGSTVGGQNLLGLNGLCGESEQLVCGNNPTITANICDSQSRIQMAEYFLDQNCNDPNLCLNWHGINMTASDGSYDERCEDVQATVNIAPLADGTHYIQLHGKDGQENWGKFILTPIASFIKDTLPPMTTKVLNPKDEKSVQCSDTTAMDKTLTNGCEYVKQGTTIILTATDPDPQQTGEHAGNVIIHYNVYWRLTESDPWVLDQTGQSSVNQPITITLNKDSYHLIEYWSTDGCNYEETHHFELDIVDTQAPITTKTVGIPKVACTQGQNCDYYITQQTPITLSCSDKQPHPVDSVSLKYRYKFNSDCGNLGQSEWSNWIGYDGTIYFREDSCHELEYYCVDALGNEEQHHTEIDVVDTQAPTIAKTIDGPSIGSCPPATDNDDEFRITSEVSNCYIDGVTNIDVTATDPQPHPVDQVTCDWSYTVNQGNPIIGETGVSSPFIVHFPEESSHQLTITCRDALGNTATDVETFLVDKTPPVTTKSYGQPLVEAVTGGYPKWITSQTPITLTVDDAGSHKSGIKETDYRVTLLTGNDACNNQDSCQGLTGDGSFLTYSAPFTIAEDSCHLIEYYSVDNVNKKEVTKKQCVFVDNKAPTSSKLVGDPKYPCIGGTDKCGSQGTFPPFYVTTHTPITFTCTDAQPHPVDNSKFCFQVSQNQQGELTNAYCESYGGTLAVGNEENYCCVNTNEQGKFTFNFLEESLHTIDWYCKDALGNEQVTQIESDNVDDTPPWIIIHNPENNGTDVTEKILGCDQSILVEIGDAKSGVNESSVYAQLIDSMGNVVENVPLVKASTQNGLLGGMIFNAPNGMDKQLPAGTYTLKVFATDNVGNQGSKNVTETLYEGIFVKSIGPFDCTISAGDNKNCVFTFNVCARNVNMIDFCMNKLGINPKLIDAVQLNATISNNNGLAYVGICNVSTGNPKDLWLKSDHGKVNGKAMFNLTLSFTSNITSNLPIGNYDLNYTINAYDP